VLKLVFGGRLEYARNVGLRTQNLTLVFKVLGQISGGEMRLARLDSDTSNQLVEELERWVDYLEHRKSYDFPVPPCP
jgi:hypothetical protein